MNGKNKAMNFDKEHFDEAIEFVASDLLNKWNAISEFNSFKEALEYTIGLGGGSTITPRIGEFWLYEYKPGYKITLKEENKKDIQVPVKYFLSVAEKIWNKEKLKVEQLKLF